MQMSHIDSSTALGQLLLNLLARLAEFELELRTGGRQDGTGAHGR